MLKAASCRSPHCALSCLCLTSLLLLLRAEMAEALKAGKLPQEILQRFLDMDSNPFLSWLMKIGCALLCYWLFALQMEPRRQICLLPAFRQSCCLAVSVIELALVKLTHRAPRLPALPVCVKRASTCLLT